jgi:hypothetical protein
MAHIELFDLDPRGEVYFPKVVQALVERFKFQKFPHEYEEFDPHKGIEFARGIIDGIAVHGLTLFPHFLALDTRASTDESESVMNEILLWCTSELGLKYKPEMISRKYYVSQLTFFSESLMLPEISPPLARLGDRVTACLREILSPDEEVPAYDFASVLLQHDQLKRKHALPGFSIARGAETPFTQNKYFSEAPCPTRVHESLLRYLEADLIASKR